MKLPLEFARISGDGRLTLVIHPGSAQVRTYWAVSECDTLEDARENLRSREGTTLKHVAMARSGDEQSAAMSDGGIAVFAWLQARQDVEAAIWTALGSNWEEKRGRTFTPNDAGRYLEQLEGGRAEAALAYSRACEYIRNTPAQIQTSVREMLRRRPDFTDAKLSAVLFEPDSSASVQSQPSGASQE